MATWKGEDSAKGMSEQFPVGLKVLLVDDDVLCLRILEQMLRKCMYSVTSCSHASAALNLLRERKGFFDIVLSDVHMPDMDGFKLLEFVGLEMDLPVIMMSGDDRTNIVMRGIRHGACDYLIKPIRTEELQNIWQHVLRKRCGVNKEHGRSHSSEDNDHEIDEYDSSINDRTDGKPKTNKRRKDAEEEDGDMENDDSNMSKKPRVVWSVELHQQFVSAVNHLGIDKAVPKRILELMNVPGLSRENVASHLQKFRQYLKKLSEVAHQQSGLSNPFGVPLEQNLKVGSLGGFDFQALAASGQISPEILASLRADVFTRPTGNSALPLVDQPTILQGSLLASEGAALDQYVAYGQPLMKCSSNTSKFFCPTVNSVDSLHSEYGSWPSKDLGNMVAFCNVTGTGEQKGNVIMSLMQHQQQQQRQQLEHNQNQSVLPEPTRLISVQPSSLVASRSSLSIAGGNNLVSANQSGRSNRNGVLEYNCLDPQSICAFGGLSGSGSTSPSVPFCSINASNSLTFTVPYSVPTCAGPSSAFVPNNSIVCSTYGPSSKLVDGLPAIIGRGTTIPRHFAVDEPALPTQSNANQARMCQEMNGNKAKQERNVNFVEDGKVGISSVQHLASKMIF